VLLVAAMSLALAAPARAQTPAKSQPVLASPDAGFDMRPIVVGLGAVAGLVAFNVLALGPGALPGGLAYGAGAIVPAEMSVAISRVYAGSSAVLGSLVAHYKFAGGTSPDQFGGSAPHENSVSDELLTLSIGAVAGVTAFNIASTPFGIVPLAGGALAPVTESVALGSRLIAVSAMSAGALGTTWLYDRWAGTQSDYQYLATLAAGAIAGVATFNFIGSGTVGIPPYYVGAGAANAAGELATSAVQAGSRVYVVGSAAIGAWLADHYYRHH